AVTLPRGDSIAARLVRRDYTTDIALLRVDRSDVQPIRLESPPVPVGTLAIAVGAEDGAPTAAFGVGSRSAGPWWSLRGGEIDARIELDLRMRRSAEGGLAIVAAGRIIAIEDGGRGVMVMKVEPQGPGAKAGVHQGDIIVSWNGEPIRHVRSLLRGLGPDSVGQTVTLGLRRAGEAKNIARKIAESPPA